MNLKTHYNIIIIGGGASGMMAAGQIVEHNPDATVLLIEKNKHLGRKFVIKHVLDEGESKTTVGQSNILGEI